MNESWRALASCIGKGHIFFAPQRERPQARAIREAEALAICESCPVIGPCAAESLGEYGIRAGMPEDYWVR